MSADLKTVELAELPKCAFCPRPGAYDSPTRRESAGHGSWAYMCDLHMASVGVMTSVTTRIVARS